MENQKSQEEMVKEAVEEAKKAAEAAKENETEAEETVETEAEETENEDAKEEAEKIKTIISDETLNRLARYTHKELGLSSLDCKYDLNESKCRECIKRNNRKKIK